MQTIRWLDAARNYDRGGDYSGARWPGYTFHPGDKLVFSVHRRKEYDKRRPGLCPRAAAQHQRYAGVRFQRDLNGDQYIIPIIHDPDIAPFAFRAVRGRKPLRLPENLSVMEVITSAGEIADPCSIPDKTTFSIVFSPSGKLVIHKVRVYRANPDDSVFNDAAKVANDSAMFQKDSDKNPPFKKEDSRNAFIIYDKNRFEQLYEIDPDTAWSRYLQHLQPVFINPYTGTIIE